MYSLGRIPSPPDTRDHPFTRYVAAAPIRPPSVPVHRYVSMDQGPTPKCVAYSSAIGRTFSEMRDEKRILTFDAPELYARCKEEDGSPNEDGTVIRVALEILRRRGQKVLASKVSTEVGKFKPIAAYARLASLEEIKTAIYLKGSVWAGSEWPNSWFRPMKNGTLPPPDFSAGGHAYTYIAYNDKKGALAIQNSWGIAWGLKGIAWVPYEYITFDNDYEAWYTTDVLGDF